MLSFNHVAVRHRKISWHLRSRKIDSVRRRTLPVTTHDKYAEKASVPAATFCVWAYRCNLFFFFFFSSYERGGSSHGQLNYNYEPCVMTPLYLTLRLRSWSEFAVVCTHEFNYNYEPLIMILLYLYWGYGWSEFIKAGGETTAQETSTTEINFYARRKLDFCRAVEQSLDINNCVRFLQP